MLLDGHLTSVVGQSRRVGGYPNTTHMSISGVAQHPLRNPQAQPPEGTGPHGGPHHPSEETPARCRDQNVRSQFGAITSSRPSWVGVISNCPTAQSFSTLPRGKPTSPPRAVRCCFPASACRLATWRDAKPTRRSTTAATETRCCPDDVGPLGKIAPTASPPTTSHHRFNCRGRWIRIRNLRQPIAGRVDIGTCVY